MSVFLFPRLGGVPVTPVGFRTALIRTVAGLSVPAGLLFPTSFTDSDSFPAGAGVTGGFRYAFRLLPRTFMLSAREFVPASVRADKSRNARRYFFELTSSQLTDGGVGVSNADASLSSQIGSDTNGIAFYPGQGVLYGGAIVFAWTAPYVPGNVIGIAVDITAGLIWFRLSATGNWNNSPTANPATGVGGISFAITGPLYPSVTLITVGDDAIANFGDSPFASAVPATYTGWATDPIAPLLVSDPDAFFNQTVSVGGAARNLAPTLLIDADSFPTALVSPRPVQLLPALLQDPDTFPAPAVTVSAIGLSVALFSDPDAFFAHTLAVARVFLTPQQLFSDPDSFGVANVAIGVRNLAAALFSDPDVFPAAAALQVGPIILAPATFININRYDPPAVVSTSSLQALGVDFPIADPDFFGVAIVRVSSVALAPQLFSDPDSFGVPVLRLRLVAATHTDPDIFPQTAAVLPGPVSLAAPGITNVNQFGIPAVSRGATDLVTTTLIDPDSFGQPVLDLVLRGAARFQDPDNFPTAIVGAGGLVLAPPLIASTSEIFLHLVHATYQLLNAAFQDPDSFGIAQVVARHRLLPQFYADPDIFFGADINLRQLFPDLFADPDAFPAAEVFREHMIDDLKRILLAHSRIRASALEDESIT